MSDPCRHKWVSLCEKLDEDLLDKEPDAYNIELVMGLAACYWIEVCEKCGLLRINPVVLKSKPRPLPYVGELEELEGENSPKTLDELCEYIVKYADSIAVREKIDGKWGSYWLTELPVKLALKHAMRFIKEGRVPIIVLKEEGETESLK